MSNLLPSRGLSHGTSLGRVPRDSIKTASVQGGGHQVGLGTSGTRGTAGTLEKTQSLQQDWQAEVSLYEIDAFAALLNVDVASIRQDVRTAADHALNSVAIQRRNGRLFIAGPKNRHSSVTFRDDALRAAVLAAACNAYQALGGTLLNRVDDDSGRDDEGIVRFCRANVGGK